MDQQQGFLPTIGGPTYQEPRLMQSSEESNHTPDVKLDTTDKDGRDQDSKLLEVILILDRGFPPLISSAFPKCSQNVSITDTRFT